MNTINGFQPPARYKKPKYFLAFYISFEQIKCSFYYENEKNDYYYGWNKLKKCL